MRVINWLLKEFIIFECISIKYNFNKFTFDVFLQCSVGEENYYSLGIVDIIMPLFMNSKVLVLYKTLSIVQYWTFKDSKLKVCLKNL